MRWINAFLHWCLDDPVQPIVCAIMLWLTLPGLFDLIRILLYLAPDFATIVFFSPQLLH